MKTNFRKMVAGALLFMTASAQALQPEVLYAFQLGPRIPYASLIEGSDGDFYGTTYEGGRNGYGTVFKVTTNGALTTLVSFDNTNGFKRRGALVLGGDGNFYGTTYEGGSNGLGTVFKMTTNAVLTSLISFNGTNGATPYAGLVVGSDGDFYGTTHYGGSSHNGTVFKVTTNGVLTTLVSFTDANGGNPSAGLVLGSDGNFYGTTFEGGSNSNWGTVFKVTSNGVLTTLVVFNSTDGRGPDAGLVLRHDGNFYGTTTYGGSREVGTVFQVSTNGVLTTLVSFNYYTNGAFPLAALALGSDGNLYGTTLYGIGSDNGTVFKVTTNGVLTTLVEFGADGTTPNELVLGSDGHFYGTTSQGGASGDGTVFQMTANRVFTTLASFTADSPGPFPPLRSDGANPQAGLLLGSNGHFFGTTKDGGSNGLGTVFQVSTNGLLTTLVSFAGTNGASSQAALVPGSDGHFYGTTIWGGISDAGTVFKVTTNGVLTTLVSFDRFNNALGAYPQGGLLLGSDGNLYGTTALGGTTEHAGTVFKVTTNGVLTSLVSFNYDNGANPRAGLVLGDDGHFYGTTAEGGKQQLWDGVQSHDQRSVDLVGFVRW